MPPTPRHPYIRNPYPPSSIHPCPRLPQVLKAQLVMIRGQGIDPLTTPAYHKFKLFTRLRRWVIGYFILHTFIIISQVLAMNLWQRVLLLVIWELVQLAITSAIGWLFKSGSGSNVYLDREEHLPLAQVAHVVEAHEMSLSWNDDADLSSQRTARWRPWAGQRRGRPSWGLWPHLRSPAAGGDAGAAAARATADDRNLPRAAAARRRTNSHAANGGARQGQPVSGVPVGAATPPRPITRHCNESGERVSVLGGCVCFGSGTG